MNQHASFGSGVIFTFQSGRNTRAVRYRSRGLISSFMRSTVGCTYLALSKVRRYALISRNVYVGSRIFIISLCLFANPSCLRFLPVRAGITAKGADPRTLFFFLCRFYLTSRILECTRGRSYQNAQRCERDGVCTVQLYSSSRWEIFCLLHNRIVADWLMHFLLCAAFTPDVCQQSQEWSATPILAVCWSKRLLLTRTGCWAIL